MSHKTKRGYQIPYLADGSIPRRVYPYNRNNITWKDREPFYAVLQLTLVGTNTWSGSLANWKNLLTDATYPMFIPELNETLEKCQCNASWIVDGKWICLKKGQSYGIRPVLE